MESLTQMRVKVPISYRIKSTVAAFAGAGILFFMFAVISANHSASSTMGLVGVAVIFALFSVPIF